MSLLQLLVFCPFLCFGSLANYTIEEKVGQLLMVHFHGKQANEAAESLILETKVGGFIYYQWTNGLDSPEQVLFLSKGLQELAQKNPSPLPLLIAVDQEGGTVTRLTQGFTHSPSNQVLGQTGNPDLAEAAAYQTGLEMRSVGINLNLAPVIDIGHSQMGARSFGTTAQCVVAFGEKALHGYHGAEMMTTLKHFPGHGEANGDSHATLPIVSKSLDKLKKWELYPFACLASMTEFIMTAHVLVPAFDQENCTTLSKKSIDYLKEKIGFKGVIMTDSLVMEGVLKKCGTVSEAAIQALNAGCDLLLLGGKLLHAENAIELTVQEIQSIHQRIVEAVKEGRIPLSRIDEAASKIIQLKLSRI